MIVGPLAWPIAQGKVTQHRRRTEPAEKPGRSYPVMSGVGKPELVRVRVNTTFSQTIEEATFDDALAEGYANFTELWEEWRNVEQTWVVRFQVETQERPRWMAANSAYGYVYSSTRALEEHEAVSPHDQRLITAESRRKFQSVKDKDLKEKLGACLDMEQRLATLELVAKQHRIDVRSEAKMAKKLLARGRNPQAQVQAMEAKLKGRWAA